MRFKYWVILWVMCSGQTTTFAQTPEESGQAAFAAIAEIVTLLNQDPDTDWSKVSIDDLRSHLVDMNTLFMRAEVDRENLPNGLRMTVTGDAATQRAIHNMIPPHVRQLNRMVGWRASVELTETGAVLEVTSKNEAQVEKIRALGFFGLMATGSHHQPHHLAMAKGRFRAHQH